MSTYLAVHRQGKDQSAETPDSLKSLVSTLLGTKQWYDPCPPNPKVDGLTTPWRRLNYVNPPFKDAKAWIEKAVEEFRKHDRESLVLIPARTQASYFHDIVFPETHTLIFILNSVQFKGYTSTFPFPLMLLHFAKRKPAFPIKPFWIPCMTMHCGRGRVDTDVFPRLREMYGPFDSEYLDAKNPSNLRLRGNKHLVCVMGDPASHVRKIMEFRAAHPDSLSIVMLVCRFNTVYFKDLVVPHAKQIIFFRPVLTFDEGASFLGSMAIAFGDVSQSKFRSQKRCVFLDCGQHLR